MKLAPMEELRKLEKQRDSFHDYIIMKLGSQDYHAVADAAMDLRELEARSQLLRELIGV